MNDDDKIVICSGKSASLAIETAQIAMKHKAQRGSVALHEKLADAKRLVDEVVAEVGA